MSGSRLDGGPSASLARIAPFGDAGVFVDLPPETDPVAAALRSQAVAARIRDQVTGRPGWGAAVPTTSSVLVHVDPEVLAVADAVDQLGWIVDEAPVAGSWPDAGPAIEIPVRYGGEDGPDLEAVAEAAGLSPSAVIGAHSSGDYRVLFLGFAPGFGYLGPLPEALVLPRRPSPRVRVPAGSVAIAGPHAAIYPIESPGGWHLIGRTAIRLWDPDRDPPALLEPGRLVRFVQVHE